MRRKLLTLIALALLIPCPAPSGAAPAEPAPTAGDGVEWHRDFAEARELAKRTGRPMMIDFVASWCKPCEVMSRDFWPRRDVVELSKKFVCVKLNFDDRGPELERFRVDRIPAVVFADSWGNLLTTKIGFGFGNRDDVLPQLMRVVPSDFSAINDWNAALERDREHAPALVGVARFYRDNNLRDVSNIYFERALKTKTLAADPAMREEVLIEVGVNRLKMKQYEDAQKSFERSLKEVPEGARADTAFLGLITAQLNRKKLADAEKTIERLRAARPGSPAVAQAEQLMQQARSLQK